jgi:hypothetical protein
VVPPPPFDIKSTWGWTTTAAALYWMIAHTYIIIVPPMKMHSNVLILSEFHRGFEGVLLG